MLNFGVRDDIHEQVIMEISVFNYNSATLNSIKVELRNLIANFDYEIDV